jgi:hypothetical protein
MLTMDLRPLAAHALRPVAEDGTPPYTPSSDVLAAKESHLKGKLAESVREYNIPVKTKFTDRLAGRFFKDESLAAAVRLDARKRRERGAIAASSSVPALQSRSLAPAVDHHVGAVVASAARSLSPDSRLSAVVAKGSPAASLSPLNAHKRHSAAEASCTISCSGSSASKRVGRGGVLSSGGSVCSATTATTRDSSSSSLPPPLTARMKLKTDRKVLQERKRIAELETAIIVCKQQQVTNQMNAAAAAIVHRARGEAAIVTLQAHIRRFCAQHRYSKLLARRRSAAALAEAQRLAALAALRQASALSIQRVIRGGLARRIAVPQRKGEVEYKWALATVGSHLQRYLARVRAKQVVALARKNAAERARLKALNSATAIQTVVVSDVVLMLLYCAALQSIMLQPVCDP